MPVGGPQIGRSVYGQARTSSAEELTETPESKVLGEIRTPTFEEDGPPPWETDPRYLRHTNDARRYVDFPESWEARWLSPKMIDHAGLRDWQTVSASDPRVTVKVPSMQAPDGTIRRGGHTGGMILAYMPRSWVESRQRIKAQMADRAMAAAVARQANFREEARRGNFGPHVAVTESKHPTHTIADGRTLDKD